MKRGPCVYSYPDNGSSSILIVFLNEEFSQMTDHADELPPYTHIPGQTPHPISHPLGHSYGQSELTDISLEEAVARGLYLFENGYFWEAHEVWEQGWILLGRRGSQADYLKGVIKLAAAGVKCLEGNAKGAQRHLNRARELTSTPGSDVAQRFPAINSALDSMFERIELMLAESFSGQD